MSAEDAAPCRHAGAPPPTTVEATQRMLLSLGAEPSLLASHGLTADEFAAALPIAIETLRGSQSAGSADRRRFLRSILDALVEHGHASSVTAPRHGDDTVYRIAIPDFGDVAIIQKGCPDGRHSSVAWRAPEWARESYLWWLCSSFRYQPGEHVVRGVHRLRRRFFSDMPDTIDGVIFHNELCGAAQRPCPKLNAAITIGGARVPPPCIYVMPARKEDASQWNWSGERTRVFPGKLLALFGISTDSASYHTGFVGFQRRSDGDRTNIVSRFGPGRSTMHRT